MCPFVEESELDQGAAEICERVADASFCRAPTDEEERRSPPIWRGKLDGAGQFLLERVKEKIDDGGAGKRAASGWGGSVRGQIAHGYGMVRGGAEVSVSGLGARGH